MSDAEQPHPPDDQEDERTTVLRVLANDIGWMDPVDVVRSIMPDGERRAGVTAGVTAEYADLVARALDSLHGERLVDIAPVPGGPGGRHVSNRVRITPSGRRALAAVTGQSEGWRLW